MVAGNLGLIFGPTLLSPASSVLPCDILSVTMESFKQSGTLTFLIALTTEGHLFKDDEEEPSADWALLPDRWFESPEIQRSWFRALRQRTCVVPVYSNFSIPRSDVLLLFFLLLRLLLLPAIETFHNRSLLFNSATLGYLRAPPAITTRSVAM